MSDETSDIDLNTHLKGVKNYRGAYLSDKIPNSPGDTNFYVVNMDSGKVSGTHWLSILEFPDKIYYFDPFGFPPNRNVLKWIKSRNKPYLYNSTDVQPINSTACGKYVKFLIANVAKGNDINSVISHLAKEGFQKSNKEVEQKF